jgi:hypothetical protein
MNSSQTFADLEYKLLNQHHDEYAAFTRLILSLAVGSFSLLAALSGTLFANANAIAFGKAAFPFLLVSILSGILVQHRIMMNPKWHLEDAAKLMAQRKADDPSPIELRRRPSHVERWFFRIHVSSFLAAFVTLSVFMFLG